MAEAADPIPVAVVGVGKIARDQHLPAIAGEPRMRLAAAVSRNATVEGVPNFVDLETYLAAGPKAAVALCTPPSARLEASLQAIAAERDLLIEKPPAATLGEIETIRAAAAAAGVVLFATWHSRFAPGVAPAADWLKGRAVERVAITWKEDVRRWHPGQDWVWRPGGFGVFDPGINALSILTEILPGQMHVAAARLEVPENCAMPIGAELDMRGPENVPVSAVFDWRQKGPQTWDIEVVAEGRSLKLSHGGGTLEIDGQAVDVGGKSEYPGIYRRFAELIATRQSDVDIAPLRICADAFLLGDRVPVAAFIE